ncbi:MAG: beta-propeller fold lactonase family protein [Verrucomicrobiota bacterium]|nr:beta-propeller fold lactonase family protein [Verrucomicrobiota bacterium]
MGANAAYVATHQSGKTLLWASYSGGVAGNHTLAPDGSVKPGELSRIEIQRCAHAILTDPSNRFAFVPQTGPNAVYQFRFDAGSGKLIKNNPLTASPAAGLEPRHLAFHPQVADRVLRR